MAPKKKTLPKDFEALLAEGDLAKLKAVFDSCDVNARGGYAKCTALSFRSCPDELTRWLVGQGADLEAVDTWGNTALHERAGDRSGKSNVQVLIELGANVNSATASIGTPLHAAVSRVNAKSVALLLAAGAKVDATNREGLTPLELGLRGCSNADLMDMAEVVPLLLAAGATKKPSMKGFVKRLGETFEFHRSAFRKDAVEATSAALVSICKLFEVEPPARRAMHDGNELITVKTSAWQDRHEELWTLLVPSSGSARTKQGEVIRIAGRIGDELHRNGGRNWDAEYTAMAEAFLVLISSGNSLPLEQLERCRAEVQKIVKSQSGDDAVLAEASVAWVMLNLKPVPLGKTSYSR